MKRIFDFSAALLGLILLSPILVALWLLVRVDSPGPGLFSQMRVGKGENEFRCYKLRTMFQDTPNVPTHFSNTTYVTRIGKWLRDTKLDELPQLWNVVKGEMSLVGPRPCLPHQTDLVELRRQNNIFSLLPGITGIAQVRAVDGSMLDEIIPLECDYLEKQNLWLDIKLIFITIFLRAGRGDRLPEEDKK